MIGGWCCVGFKGELAGAGLVDSAGLERVLLEAFRQFQQQSFSLCYRQILLVCGPARMIMFPSFEQVYGKAQVLVRIDVPVFWTFERNRQGYIQSK